MEWNKARLSEAIDDAFDDGAIDLYIDLGSPEFADQMLDGVGVVDWTTEELAAKIQEQIDKRNWTETLPAKDAAVAFERLVSEYTDPIE